MVTLQDTGFVGSMTVKIKNIKVNLIAKIKIEHQKTTFHEKKIHS